jgi:hypothetical protein
MFRDHHLDFEIIIAFSTENESDGSPYICHSLILTGSPNIVLISKVGLEGILHSKHFATYSVVSDDL